MTHNDNWAACAASVNPELMEAVFVELAADLAPVYRRRDVRANGLSYVRGLLMPQVSGNCWSIAAAVGLDRPYRLHHLLERACWDKDAVRSFLARHLGPLDALLRERHVSRAADQVGLSQPAMSHALQRLRHTLGDELLVRGPGG